LSRRSVVAVAAVGAAGAVAGCSGGARTRARARTAAEPGMAERARTVRDSTALLGTYDAVLAAHPALTGRLAPLRAEVARHIQVFGGTAPPPGRAARPATPPGAGASAADGLAALAAREQALAEHRATALLTVPGELARLLASVAAAGAGHVVLLDTRGAGAP